VELSRPCYLCWHCSNGQFPADVELDIENTGFSLGVRCMQAVAGQEALFDHGRRQMKLLADLAAPRNSIRLCLAAPLCSPGKVLLLTGRSPARSGVNCVLFRRLDGWNTGLPEGNGPRLARLFQVRQHSLGSGRLDFRYPWPRLRGPSITKCPSLPNQQIPPRVPRRTCAMVVLQATHDIRKVSLWLGHGNLATTEIRIRADPTEKPEAIGAVVPPHLRRGSFRPADKLISVLKAKS
jgi:hypothetical protein